MKLIVCTILLILISCDNNSAKGKNEEEHVFLSCEVKGKDTNFESNINETISIEIKSTKDNLSIEGTGTSAASFSILLPLNVEKWEKNRMIWNNSNEDKWEVRDSRRDTKISIRDSIMINRKTGIISFESIIGSSQKITMKSFSGACFKSEKNKF